MLILITSIWVIPLAIDLINSIPIDSIEMGFMFLPFPIALLICPIFGLIAIWNYIKYSNITKSFLIGIYTLIVASGYGMVIIAPPISLLFFAAFIPLIVTIKVGKEKLGLHLLINNSLIIILSIVTLIVLN